MVLRIFVDPISQPSRALMLFVRAANIPVEEKLVSIASGEHRSKEFAAVNPFRKVPSIIHDGFHLSESVAIFRYLARSFPAPSHWFPQEAQEQARIDEYLAWQHLGLRMPCTRLIFALIMPHMLGFKGETPEKDKNKIRGQAVKALNEMENIWLANSNFVAGDNISVADLLAIGEIEMMRLIGFAFNVRDNRPKLSAYIDRVRETLGPTMYDEVHRGVDEMTAVFKPT